MKILCAMCNINKRRPTHAYCLNCHSKSMRKYRNTHELTAHQRKIMNCHSYAHVYMKRGKIIKKSCEKCGNINSQMHHPNYNEPLNIIWLCRPCHLQLHKIEHSQSL